MGPYTPQNPGGQKWQAGGPHESHDDQHRDHLDHNPQQSSTWHGDSTQEQLVAEFKAIYAILVEFEKRCIEIGNAQNTQSDPNIIKFNSEQWQSLVALGALFHEQYNFFCAAIHLSPSPSLKRLAAKYAMRRRSHTIDTDLLSTLGWISQFISMSGQRADGELLRWVQMTEDVLDRLYKRFWRVDFEELVYLWLLYRLFAEFPNGVRHLCTTMPWTIWPALVVLWGVCWMFIQNQAGPREDPSPLPRPFSAC